MELPLEGVRILSMAPWVPGLYCNMLLADLGSDVILIERPDDTMRDERPPGFLSILNRNKKSITINLKSQKGREVLNRLVKQTDVFLVGLRPDTIQRMGIDYKSLKKIKSNLIYCSITGFGEDSPYSDYPAHNNTYMGLAGMVHPLPQSEITYSSTVYYADLISSMYAAFSILAALRFRDRKGKGQYLEVPIADCALSWMIPTLGVFYATGKLRPESPATYFYRTSDGKYISLSVLVQDNLWRNLCHAIGLERFASLSHKERENRFYELETMISEIISHLSRDEWLKLLHVADAPGGPVLTLEELRNDPHIKHRQLIVDVEDNNKRTKGPQVVHPVRFSETPATIRKLAPELGEDTIEVLQALGYSRGEINDLKKGGEI